MKEGDFYKLRPSVIADLGTDWSAERGLKPHPNYNVQIVSESAVEIRYLHLGTGEVRSQAPHDFHADYEPAKC